MVRVRDGEIEVADGRENPDLGPRFTESVRQRLRRWFWGTAYALVPKRIGVLPRLMRLSVAHAWAPKAERDKLPGNPVFYGKRGLIGISNDLSVASLVANYSRGYFPVCHIGAMKWWCPEERAVIDPADTHVGKNLRRLLRQGKFRVTFDQDFARVIEACATPRPGKMPLTWITPHHAGLLESA
jgi:leucyl/phenylalanyl-tRNA--protein transferase